MQACPIINEAHISAMTSGTVQKTAAEVRHRYVTNSIVTSKSASSLRHKLLKRHSSGQLNSHDLQHRYTTNCIAVGLNTVSLLSHKVQHHYATKCIIATSQTVPSLRHKLNYRHIITITTSQTVPSPRHYHHYVTNCAIATSQTTIARPQSVPSIRHKLYQRYVTNYTIATSQTAPKLLWLSTLGRPRLGACRENECVLKYPTEKVQSLPPTGHVMSLLLTFSAYRLRVCSSVVILKRV